MTKFEVRMTNETRMKENAQLASWLDSHSEGLG